MKTIPLAILITLLFQTVSSKAQSYGNNSEQTLAIIRQKSRMSSSVKHDIEIVYENGAIDEIVVKIQNYRSKQFQKYLNYKIRYVMKDGVYSSKIEQYYNISFEDLVRVYKRDYPDLLLEENDGNYFFASSSLKSLMWLFLHPIDRLATILYSPAQKDKICDKYFHQIDALRGDTKAEEDKKRDLEKLRREKEIKEREKKESEARREFVRENKLDKPYYQRTDVEYNKKVETVEKILFIIKFKDGEMQVKRKGDYRLRDDLVNLKGRPYYGYEKSGKKISPNKGLLYLIDQKITNKTGTYRMAVIEFIKKNDISNVTYYYSYGQLDLDESFSKEEEKTEENIRYNFVKFLE